MHEQSKIATLASNLDKVVRGIRLYRGEGEMVERMVAALAESATAATADGPLTVNITALGMSRDGQLVSPGSGRVSYLFRLYCDGVRELTFAPGVDADELRSLAGVLATDARHSDEDLVTLLWKQQLPHVGYYAVDTFVSGSAASAGQYGALAREQQSRLDPTEGGAAIALTSDDLRVLQSDEALDWVRVARAPLALEPALAEKAAGLVARFHQTPDFDAFMDIAHRVLRSDDRASAMVLDLFDGLLQAREDASALGLLEAVARHPESPEAAELLRADRMGAIAPLFEAHHRRALRALETLITPAALSGALALLTRLRPGEALDAWEALLRERGLDITPYYARSLESEDEGVLLDAVDSLARIHSPESMEAVTRALSNSLCSVRHAALEALLEHYQDTARVALGRSLQDPDKENRLLALKVVAASADPRFGWALVHVVDSPEFDHLDEDEQQAFYEAIAALHDDRTLDHFKRLLSRRTLLGARMVAHHQALAAQALGGMNTAAAWALLEQNRDRWFHAPEVKDAVRETLGRRS